MLVLSTTVTKTNNYFELCLYVSLCVDNFTLNDDSVGSDAFHFPCDVDEVEGEADIGDADRRFLQVGGTLAVRSN